MFKNPKNAFESSMNIIFEEVDTHIQCGTYAGLEPIAANLITIYNALSPKKQKELSDNFNQILVQTICNGSVI